LDGFAERAPGAERDGQLRRHGAELLTGIRPLLVNIVEPIEIAFISRPRRALPMALSHLLSRSMIPLLGAVLVGGLACRRAPAEPSPPVLPSAAASDAPAVVASATPPAVVASAAATTRPSEPAAPDCAVHLDDIEFHECNPRPTQKDYPECWTYSFMTDQAADAGPSCPPKHGDLFIGGWPGISDQKRIEIAYDGDPPKKARLIRVGKDTGPGFLGDTAGGSGPDLGTLIFEGGVVKELVFGPGMHSHLHSRSVRASPSR
jgi:hypothetical protein